MVSGVFAPIYKEPCASQVFFGFPARPVPPRVVRTLHVLTRQAGCKLPNREELHGPKSVGHSDAPSAGASLRPSASTIAGSTSSTTQRPGPMPTAPSQSQPVPRDLRILTVAALLTGAQDNDGTPWACEQAFIDGLLRNLDTDPDNAPVTLALAAHPDRRTREASAVTSASTTVDEDICNVSGSFRASTASTSQPSGEGGTGRQLLLHELGFRATKKSRLAVQEASLLK